MANYSIKFFGSVKSETETHNIECYKNINNEIFVKLHAKGFPTLFICLDKSTAIKFAKTLRTEINKIGGTNE